jgi:glutamate dehydrogenase/leucine dehydrogenase
VRPDPPPVEPVSEIFDLVGDEHEQVVFFRDAAAGLRAIVAVHSTALGPAMGGTRFLPYPSETAGLVDVLRLSRGMTYKQAVAGIDYGGGKAVIFGDPARVRTDELMRTYGRFLDRLGGTYLTAEDVGTTQADMDLLRSETPYVTGTSPSLGGSGDPSPATAWGVLHAMRAVARRLWADPSLSGRRVVVSGMGKVGSALTRHLLDEEARVVLADPRADALAPLAAERGVDVVDHHAAHREPCDLFSPCALGAVLNVRTIPELRCAAVVGAANNQLATSADGRRIAERGIVYVPDFVANAGGVINIAEEPPGYDRDRAFARVARIESTTEVVLARAERDDTTPVDAAEAIAEERLTAARPG